MAPSTAPPPDLSIADIQRNDLAAAEAYYKRRGRTLSADEYRILRGLQDDPAKFERLSRRWHVTPTGGHALDNRTTRRGA
jgi:hypothetical protein